MIRPVMPWEPEGGRKAVWYEVYDPAGRRLGMFLHLDHVNAWVVGKPGVRWRVVHWFDGRIEARYEVRARRRRRRMRPWERWTRIDWRKVPAKKGGG